jgi:hypothetical protein
MCMYLTLGTYVQHIGNIQSASTVIEDNKHQKVSNNYCISLSTCEIAAFLTWQSTRRPEF